MPKELVDTVCGFLSDRYNPLLSSIDRETSLHLLLKEPPFVAIAVIPRMPVGFAFTWAGAGHVQEE